MKRPKPTPARPSWHDPDMPVLGKSGREIDHRKMQLKAQMAMVSTTEPLYRTDPTYNLRRKPK